MRKQCIIILLSLFYSGISECVAQKIGIKMNLLYGAYTRTPNLGIELGISSRSTLELNGGYNWFTSDKVTSYKKLVHWLGVGEYRYWTCERFNGHFWGIHVLGTQYNIVGHKLPLLFGSDSKQFRYEGFGVGGGLSYGYHFFLGNRWSMEANIGVGYIRLHYDKFRCETCGEKIKTENRNYFGPTKAAISLVYLIK
ncbi:DUF3575 domain-containing protein [Bacteroides nordii]|uniref:DUF3575 domain-containing protein n=1 Tax=Bacteroides nordii TaxID=291645 RepID=UPI001F2B1B57|nr:DUF3575 domain-containing protein [Bacteroides nordii]MCE8464515.1 DUF3575 domain-containing protein [Bacteroides nordii]UYU49879.1 DUF3575 domain-containing protein [Bacteroides nordii]